MVAVLDFPIRMPWEGDSPPPLDVHSAEFRAWWWHQEGVPAQCVPALEAAHEATAEISTLLGTCFVDFAPSISGRTTLLAAPDGVALALQLAGFTRDVMANDTGEHWQRAL